MVNKRLNNISNQLLWREVLLLVPRGQTRASWKRCLIDTCDSLTCNPRLSSSVRRLDIRLYGVFHSGGGVVRTNYVHVAPPHLSRLLTSMPSLTTLHIYVLSGQREIIPVLSQTLSETSFKFRLVDFLCDAAMMTYGGGIYPFLAAQNTIQKLSHIHQRVHGPPVLPLDETGRREMRAVLPFLREYRGPPMLVRAVTAGRTLDAVIVDTVLEILPRQEEAPGGS